MCVSLLGAQNITNLRKAPAQKQAGQRVAKTAMKHAPKHVKFISNTKDPIPAGYARVTFMAANVWNDGTGYQMLIDSNATAYGTIIPATGPIDTADVPDSIYAAFEWKIPSNADGNLSTTNIVIDSTIILDIPAGTYDYCITNPTPNSAMWIAGGSAARADNFAFVSGKNYAFSVAMNAAGTGDLVTLMSEDPEVSFEGATGSTNVVAGTTDTIIASFKNNSTVTAVNVPTYCVVTDPSNNPTVLNLAIDSIATGETKSVSFPINYASIGEYSISIFCAYPGDVNTANDSLVGVAIDAYPVASLTYTFDDNDGEWPPYWGTYNLDGNELNSQLSSYFSTNDGWELIATQDGGYVAGAASYFDEPDTADRWLYTGPIALTTGNYLQFYGASASANYPETMDVLVSTNLGRATTDFSNTLSNIEALGSDKTTYTFDLSAYASDTVRFAFHLISEDATFAIVDNVKILNPASEIQLSSLNNVASNASFSVYPNPATDFVTLSNANGAQVKVIDIMGRVVMQQTINSNSQQISTKALENGVYMLQVTNNGNTTTQKLIKK